ncbi:YdcF family protein [Marinobacterium arenosum]|uniref:YdcF family protein n=1 Tax=Marinobacterium arenosum TaxID=2862496 RepID=UPI001C9642CC|nr:YdcF family protein [Marinobacterium arenosum]MBY4676153.1 YdcF family protein [Marinobacterium arenosum]
MDLFFTAAKIAWLLLQPDHLLLLLLLLATLLLWAGQRRLGLALLSPVVLLLLVLAVLPLGQLLLRPLESRFPTIAPPPAERLGGIIVLGGAELPGPSEAWQQAQFNGAAERLMALVPLLRRYPDLPVIYSGGSGSLARPDQRGADLAQAWLAEAGLAQRVRFERDSRNTWQNAGYSLAMLDSVPDKRWLLVTSAAHMPRAVGVFRRQGWPVIGWPVDFNSAPLGVRPQLWRNLSELSLASHEWLGLSVYYLTGKTSQWFPAPEQK